MARALFVGIDLTSSAKKPSACVVLDEELRLCCWQFLASDADIFQVVDSHHPLIVAIDSPLGLPRGLCCLEESCPCQPIPPLKGRLCERELSRRGIPCYYTTKRSIIKPMVYRAINLRKELSARGCQVIEVYPYATKVALFGKAIPPKSKPCGAAFLKGRIAHIMPRLASYLPGFGHDLCDALLAAYTAYLYAAGEAEVIGDLEEGAICMPTIGAAPLP